MYSSKNKLISIFILQYCNSYPFLLQSPSSVSTFHTHMLTVTNIPFTLYIIPIKTHMPINISQQALINHFLSYFVYLSAVNRYSVQFSTGMFYIY